MKRSKNTFSNIAVVSRPDNLHAIKTALHIIKYLRDNKINATPELTFAQKANLNDGKKFSELFCDAIITVGGDGTVLRTCMQIPEPETPILAVNMGRRGYLTEIGPDHVQKSIKKLLAGRYHIEQHAKLSVYLDKEYIIDGLNEALLVSASPSKMLKFQLSYGEDQLIATRGDGLIISTPTGSTAHAFSAGGPALHTRLKAFNIVFLSPIDPIKGLITPNNENIHIELLDGSGAILVIDGCVEYPTSIKSTVTIKLSEKSANFIRFEKKFITRSLARLIKSGIDED